MKHVNDHFKKLVTSWPVPSQEKFKTLIAEKKEVASETNEPGKPIITGMFGTL